MRQIKHRNYMQRVKPGEYAHQIEPVNKRALGGLPTCSAIRMPNRNLPINDRFQGISAAQKCLHCPERQDFALLPENLCHSTAEDIYHSPSVDTCRPTLRHLDQTPRERSEPGAVERPLYWHLQLHLHLPLFLPLWLSFRSAAKEPASPTHTLRHLDRSEAQWRDPCIGTCTCTCLSGCHSEAQQGTCFPRPPGVLSTLPENNSCENSPKSACQPPTRP